MNILFWNIGKNNLTPEITKLVQNYNPTIFVIAENEIDTTSLLNYINKFSIDKYKILPKNKRNTSILIKENINYTHIPTIARQLITLEYEYNGQKYLVCAIHMDSKLMKTTDDQSNISRNVIEEINKIENDRNNSNTIIIGDFNMNPFENGMVFPDTFNAVSSKTIASKNKRVVNDTNKKYKYFYNPMWSYMGDLSKHSPGTYYLRENSHRNHFVWNMYDQVLIRPELMNRIDENSVEIINETEVGIKLSPRMQYETITPSDHLPLFIKFN
jgi:hypothetical protein